MNRSSLSGVVKDLFSQRKREAASAKRRRRSPGGAGAPERLEERRLLAFDLVAAYAQADTPFYVSGQTASRLTEAPQQITLRFSPGVQIDGGSLAGVRVLQPGADGLLGTPDDASVVPGFIGVDDAPNGNQVVIRFADTLPDGTYRIDVGAGLTSTNSGSVRATSIDVRLDRGAYVMAVVPQPITRNGSGQLVQSRNTIAVHFNANDPLNQSLAQNRFFYRLVEVDADGVDSGTSLNPATVTYAAATGVATLSFAADLPDGKLFRLEIGEAAAGIPGVFVESAPNNSSFMGAQDLGILSSGGITLTGSIAVQPVVTTPAGGLLQPSPDGSRDEPGHRDHPFADSFTHGGPFASLGPAGPLATIPYNFQEVIGADSQGNPLYNVITEIQKERAREIFDLISLYTGARFVETPNAGLTVATGDLRALVPDVSPAVAGLGGWPNAFMNSSFDWGEGEYGGRWFKVAMHEIFHALGLEHTYDLPSVMGAALSRNPATDVEPSFPGDYDIGHLRQLFPNHGSDIDVFRFQVAEAGTLTAETLIARPGQPVTSLLDSVVTLYRQNPATGRQEMIARNDDSYGRDSFLGLELEAGSYFLAVTSTGNTSFNPEVADSGAGGRTEGAYELRLGFTPRSLAENTIVDVTGTPLDGNRDGNPGGLFRFWFNTAAQSDTIYVDRANMQVGNGVGTLGNPFKTISAAVAAANADPGKRIIRIVGNTAGSGGRALPYEVGTNQAGVSLRDGRTFNVPAGVTVMIDAGAVLKLRSAIIDVGSSSPLVSRSGASIQVLGTPDRNVVFTSWHDDSIGGNSDGVGPAPQGGQWGGIVLRADSDAASQRAFVNTIGLADIRYGGGQVVVESQFEQFAPIQLESARPTVVFNHISHSAGAGIAATPNSFEDSNGRFGPEVRGNTLRDNSINGLFVKIETQFGLPLDQLDVPARFTSTDIVHVITENFVITGGAGGYALDGANIVARATGRLTIDPGVVVKLQGSRIELERGLGRLYAEGLPNRPVVFTSLGDNRFGAGGTFDTNGNLPDVFAPGDWGGIVLNAGSGASIDHAYLGFGGGTTPIEGGFDQFNVIEVHQGDLRLANSRVERNASGRATTGRNGRGTNAAAAVFVRGAQPIIVGNDFRGNAGAVVSINANSLNETPLADAGRGTGGIGRFAAFDDNLGPLVRGNVIAAVPGGGAILGMQVRGEEITTETVWDDTDIVHVLQRQIRVENFHSATGVRLQSRPGASLVVKLDGPDAGFTAAGYPLDIEDRIGGTVQIVGQPGYPVILTSLRDDTVGAGLDPLGRPLTDTNADGAASAPAPGDWGSLQFLPYSNDRNVAVFIEAEPALTGGVDTNGTAAAATPLGTLAPNFRTGTNTWESAQEKSGDEYRRLGFEVHGFISPDDPADVDIYSFQGYGGSEVWIDLDKTASGLDVMVELLNASGQVIARSADAQTDEFLAAATRGLAQPLEKDAWRGLDHFTQNRRDAGMRVILPAPQGAQAQYFVRVRSQPRYNASTTQSAYEADLRADDPLVAGVTSGGYQLRIRLRQLDEKPGSTVQYADIRYATIGIDVQGLPRNSLLLGDTGENPTDDNGTFAAAQYIGNLLQSDRGTITVAGRIETSTDIDWYTFALNYEQIQAIGGLSVPEGGHSWATVFDIDYGDGFRGDLTLSVFDDTGRLIYVGRDSDVRDDQPGPGQSAPDFDDLSRGSVGKLDPFIGSVHLAAGGPTGGGGYDSGDDPTPPDPSAQRRYYVAVSSNAQLPESLNATFTANPLNHLVRLEPISSLRRVVDDRIGDSLLPIINTDNLGAHITPFTLADVTLFVTNGTSLVTVDAMRGGVETTIVGNYGGNTTIGDMVMRSDGNLYLYRGITGNTTTAGQLVRADAGTGAVTVIGNDDVANPVTTTQNNLAPSNAGTVPIAITTFQLAAEDLRPPQDAPITGSVRFTRVVPADPGPPAVPATTLTGTWTFTANPAPANGTATLTIAPVGVIDPLLGSSPVTGTVNLNTGVVSIRWSANVPTADVLLPEITYTSTFNDIRTDQVDAVAWRRAGVGTYDNLVYSVWDPGNARSFLYLANPATGSADFIDGQNWGIQGSLDGVGRTTGLAWLNGTLYGVDRDGGLFTVTGIDDGNFQVTVTPIETVLDGLGIPIDFQGLAVGPQNLNDGFFADTLFAIDGRGNLYCLDTDGNLLTVFDSDNNGTADATFIDSGVGGARGLAFSPLDINLWHQTSGQGIDAMYFGLERLAQADPDSEQPGYQFGGSLAWQQDLLSNPAIGNNYNLPGGAHGSLTTNSFGLDGYTYTDKPTLYFTYWLDTEGATGGNMLDSARVHISSDGGLSWQLLATNNSQPGLERPPFLSASSRLTAATNQHVQELFDTANWRQARIDLGEWAGESDLRLRFDFSTAGMFDATQRDAAGDLLNDITEPGNTGWFNSARRGQNNQFGGFYIDDIVVGFAERGEMVTGANSSATGFFGVDSPTSILTGEYQLEIRRGTEYQNEEGNLVQTFDTNDRLVPSAGFSALGMPRLGDSNLVREQGQFIVANNLISDSVSYGIRIDAGARDPYTAAPLSGVPRNLPTLNGGRLAPGAVVMNNVIAGSGTAGILFSGDPNTGNVPLAAVPFGRLVNNTIYGGPTAQGIGVEVTDNAGPTLINNLFANLATGVSVDASSRLDTAGNQRTVVGASAYFNVGTQVAGANQTFPLVLAGDPFVNADTRNFYLRPGSAAIDSGLNSLQDRTEYRAVNSSIGVGAFPILAPDRDLFGQLRSDDPGQASAPGLGANVFKDRGAIERVDNDWPYARIDVPQDNGAADWNPDVDAIQLRASSARGITQFVLHLQDTGVGIDPATVSSAAFQLTRDGTLLEGGIDYVFGFNALNGRVVFESPAVFASAAYEIRITQENVSGVSRNVIKDLAGNPLQPNRDDGTTVFTIEMAEAPGVPTGVVGSPGDGRVSLSWTAPATSGSSAISDYVIDYSSDSGATWTTFAHAASPATTIVVTGLTNGVPYTFRVAAVNGIGQGDFSAPSAPVTPVALPPNQPVDVVGTPGNGQVSVAWTAPFDGGQPITDYEIQFSSDGGTIWTTFTDGPSTATATTVTGLTNGTPYVFRVRATNVNGPGSYSLPSAPVTPRGLASAPGLAGTRGDGSVTLTWTTPFNGGSPITGYVIERTVNGGTTTQAVGVGTTAILSGLVNGTPHAFRVAAVTAVGTGAWSNAVALTPLAPPGAPTGLAAQVGEGSLTLSWVPPASTGGAPITGYTVRYTLNGSPVTVEVGLATSTVISGLANGTAYQLTFTVQARNEAGVGPQSAAFQATFVPQRPMAAPTRLTARASRDTVSLAWTAPRGAPRGSIVGYDIQASTNGGATWFNAGSSPVTRATVTVPALGTPHVFRVRARTTAGGSTAQVAGDWSANSIAVTPFDPRAVPAAPTNLSVLQSGRTATLSWTPPPANAGGPVTSYVIQYKLRTSSSWRTVRSATITNLAPGTYDFRVQARNLAGLGAFASITQDMGDLGLRVAQNGGRQRITIVPRVRG